MREWVSTLRSKLREMKIISPKENLYSRLPEVKLPLLPTRDPMSPLPAPPPVPAAIVPGIEPLPQSTSLNGSNGVASSSSAQPQHSLQENSAPVNDTQRTTSSPQPPSDAHPPAVSLPISSPCSAMSNTLTQNLLNMLSDPIVNLTNRLAQEGGDSCGSSPQSFLDRPSTSKKSEVQSRPLIDTDSDASSSSYSSSSGTSSKVNSLARTFTNNVLNDTQNITRRKTVITRDESTESSTQSLGDKTPPPLVIPRPQTTLPVVVSDQKPSSDGENVNPPTTTNITIIQLSDPVALAPSSPTVSAAAAEDKTSFMANIEVNCPSSDTTTVKVTANSGYDEIRNSETGVTNISVGAILIQSPAHSETASASAGNYEQVFIARDRNNNSNSSSTTPQPMPYSVFLLSQQQRSASHVELTIPQRNRVHVNGSTQTTRNDNDTIIETARASSPPPLVLPTPSTSGGRPRRAALALPTDGEPTNSNSPLRSSRQRGVVVPTEQVEARKRSSSTSAEQRNGASLVHPRIVSPPRLQSGRPTAIQGEGALNSQRSGRLSLREQQVLQLRREIMHPGGVRLQLRRKDCIGSIALVDVFNSVWIAGWKQKDHPMLYNALHIGDRLVSVGGVAASSSSDVNKLIRLSSSAYIELIVRRVPCGRVFAIRREMDGQCLGLIRESNTATIVDIIPNGLAARHGLPMKANSCDGLSLTFWVLTEINGRPLNLFFKDNEIQDRLNAVGRDISILVQPLDLITKLKKQLKSMRGYKDFIVQ